MRESKGHSKKERGRNIEIWIKEGESDVKKEISIGRKRMLQCTWDERTRMKCDNGGRMAGSNPDMGDFEFPASSN